MMKVNGIFGIKSIIYNNHNVCPLDRLTKVNLSFIVQLVYANYVQIMNAGAVSNLVKTFNQLKKKRLALCANLNLNLKLVNIKNIFN